MPSERVANRFANKIPYVLGGAVLALLVARPPAEEANVAERGIARWSLRLLDFPDEESMGAECGVPQGGGLSLPTGAPASLSCESARTIITQVRDNLAAVTPPVDAAKFAGGAADWLDPHGLWSAAPDSPIAPLFEREAEQLLRELEGQPPSNTCASASVIGAALAGWMTELRGAFLKGMQPESAKTVSLADAWQTVCRGPFQDGPITRSGRDLARQLGRELRTARAAYGAPIEPFVTAAQERLFPDLSADAWARVVIAAAVRAYVPQIDAHGAWAPLEEEISIYDLDLETHPPQRLWSEMTRTALGVRVDHGALAPLHDGDVILSIRGVALAGMSVEQAEQSAIFSDLPHGPAISIKVLRSGLSTPLELVMQPSAPQPVSGKVSEAEDLQLDWIRYGDGRAAVIAIHDVPDDLGDRMSSVLMRVLAERDARGVMLDIRANGGGSTDGAIAALGHFLPGATLFPMRRRDGGIEIERAPEIPLEHRWTGPLAVLVDGDSASAAEMIAGAIASYRRGVVVGDRTYGKGCAQEYLDDDAHAGVLRLTTLLFALPDGTPVQKTGISPQITLSLPSATEREASLPKAFGPWRGPDVRDSSLVHAVPWPMHGGRVGPCQDEALCRSLRVIGAAAAASR
jgi:carboxyl-terminal processing protease